MTNEIGHITRILVGIDDHEQSRDALSLAVALARTTGADLLVAAAIEYDPLPIGTEFYDQARAEHFTRLFTDADEFLRGVRHRRFELDREPVAAMVDLADSEGADVVVIGSTHRGFLSRALNGTIADRLVESGGCSVLVAPRGYAGREHAGFGTIGVGSDGSAGASHALHFAERLAAALGCELRLIAAVPAYEDVADPLRATREGMYRERAAVGRRSVSAVPASEVVELGDAAHVLASQGLDLDFLVVGSHGRGRLGRATLGSVASELVRLGPCPVFVVPRAENSADPADHGRREEAQA